MSAVESVRAALADLERVTLPGQRRRKLMALLAAGSALADLVGRMERWLNREFVGLMEMEGGSMATVDSAYEERLAKWTADLRTYQEAFTLLGIALKKAKEDR